MSWSRTQLITHRPELKHLNIHCWRGPLHVPSPKLQIHQDASPNNTSTLTFAWEPALNMIILLPLTYISSVFSLRELSQWPVAITVIDGSWVTGGAPAQTEITNSSVSGRASLRNLWHHKRQLHTPIRWCETSWGDAGVIKSAPRPESIPISH